MEKKWNEQKCKVDKLHNYQYYVYGFIICETNTDSIASDLIWMVDGYLNAR